MLQPLVRHERSPKQLIKAEGTRAGQTTYVLTTIQSRKRHLRHKERIRIPQPQFSGLPHPYLPKASMHTDERKFPLQPSEVADTGSLENGRDHLLLQPAEEQARAFFYSLLATLLLSPPSTDLLHALAHADPIAGETGELESAWEQLVLVAGIMDAEAVREEFDGLFVSTGTPLINPHASLYLSGFMMDRPLAALRDTLRELGVVRRVDVSELEDHLGSLFETMALLIQHGKPLQLQKDFFKAHIAGWVYACMDDMRNAQGANFYLHVAHVLEAFIGVEGEAFTIGNDGAT